MPAENISNKRTRRTRKSGKNREQKVVLTLSNEIKRKRTIAVLIIGIAALGLFTATRFGLASFYYVPVKNAIAKWQYNSASSSQLEFDEVKTNAGYASSIHGPNPLYIDAIGQLHEWGVVLGYTDLKSLQTAKNNYLASTQLRPLWPVTWANLAMVKWRLNELDSEMLNYLTKADQLGQYSIEVHLLFTRLGISLYQANHPIYGEIKNSVHSRIGKGLRNSQSKSEILAIIQSTDSMQAVCRWVQAIDDYTANQHLMC